jgi:hypothetical protein
MNLKCVGLFAEIRTGVSRMQNRCPNHIPFLWQMPFDVNLHVTCMTAYAKDLWLFDIFLRLNPQKQNTKLKCWCLYWHVVELNLPFSLRERLWRSRVAFRWIPRPYKLILTCFGHSLTLRRLYKYYVFGHYPSSCLYLKTVLFIFQNTTFRRLDSVSVFR